MKESNLVLVCNLPVGKTWLAGTMRMSQGPLLFNVELGDG